MEIIKDTRYGNPNYLNFSTLASCISYDSYGGMRFNPMNALIKKDKKKSEAMIIWTIVDEHFTEWVNFYDTYKKVSRRSGDNDTELTCSMYDSIDNIIQTINEIPYNADVSFRQYMTRCLSQSVLHDDKLMIKGKLDFYNEEDNKIIDLKCTGSIDIFLKDLVKFNLSWLSIHHRYNLQLAWYSHLVEINYGTYPRAELLAVSHAWEPIRIDIPEAERRQAFEVLKWDIELLRATIASGNTIYTFRPAIKEGIDDTIETADDDFLDNDFTI